MKYFKRKVKRRLTKMKRKVRRTFRLRTRRMRVRRSLYNNEVHYEKIHITQPISIFRHPTTGKIGCGFIVRCRPHVDNTGVFLTTSAATNDFYPTDQTQWQNFICPNQGNPPAVAPYREYQFRGCKIRYRPFKSIGNTLVSYDNTPANWRVFYKPESRSVELRDAHMISSTDVSLTNIQIDQERTCRIFNFDKNFTRYVNTHKYEKGLGQNTWIQMSTWEEPLAPEFYADKCALSLAVKFVDFEQVGGAVPTGWQDRMQIGSIDITWYVRFRGRTSIINPYQI